MSAPHRIPVSPPSGRPLEELLAKAQQMRARAEVLKVELAEVKAVVTSSDEVATVEVGAGGILRAIRVGSQGRAAGPELWAKAVMSAYAKACREVGEQAAALVDRQLPGSPAAEMMREALPPEPPEAEAGRGEQPGQRR